MSLRQEDYYQPGDMQCGSAVRIYGRDCLIYDCDDFTRAWYAKNLQMNQVAVALKKPKPSLVY
jgi:hypothetical protein